jgi:hypothetical protein
MSLTITVHDTIDRQEIRELQARNQVLLSPQWCECDFDEFLCYPEDGECDCGVHKHHVHCTCGKISQVG